jgi:hypothetical protein
MMGVSSYHHTVPPLNIGGGKPRIGLGMQEVCRCWHRPAKGGSGLWKSGGLDED